MPSVLGLADCDPLTSDTLWSLTSHPGRLAILGGGPIGAEIAQAMARLGVAVTLLQRGDRLIPRDDPDAGAIVLEALRADGVDVRLRAGVRGAERARDGSCRLLLSDDAEPVIADRILVATGRRPNIEGLGLRAAGVATGPFGVRVDHLQRTSNRRIYAAGDVCSAARFTHTAYAQAEHAAVNALLPVRMDWRKRVVPRVTFTAPEVAHVGPSHAEIAAMGDRVRTITVGLDRNDRLRLEGAEAGFARVHLRAGSDRILAATIVCEAAGELIAELTLAIQQGIGLAAIGRTIHAYPTRADLVRKLADEYNFGRITPGIARGLRLWIRLLR